MNRRQALQVCVSGSLLASAGVVTGHLFGMEGPASKRSPRAVLITGGKGSLAAMRADRLDVYQALQRRGFRSTDVIQLDGSMGGAALLDALRGVARVVELEGGSDLFLHYSGCGMIAEGQRAGLDLTQQESNAVLWEDVIKALRPRPAVRLLILADCCRTHLLVGKLPANVVGLCAVQRPGNPECTVFNHQFPINGKPVERGVISYYAAQALAKADTMKAWLRQTRALIDQDVKDNVLPTAKDPNLVVLGDQEAVVPGKPVAC